MLDMRVGRLYEQDALSKVQHDRIVDDREDSTVHCFDACHWVVVNLDISLDACMIVLTLAQYAILLILLNLIESDQGIAALIFYRFSEDAVLVVAAKSVH